MNQQTIFILIGIIACIIIGYFIFVQMYKNKKVKSKTYDLTIDIEALVNALKGYQNIKEVSSTPSKVRFELENTDVDVDKIKALGASGIVESTHSITLIFGKQSQAICDYIKDHQ